MSDLRTRAIAAAATAFADHGQITPVVDAILAQVRAELVAIADSPNDDWRRRWDDEEIHAAVRALADRIAPEVPS